MLTQPAKRQPRPGRLLLNRSPLTAGLLVAAPFNMGGGPPQDVAYGYTSIFGSTLPTSEVSAAGLVLGTAATSTQYVEWPDSILPSLASTSWTVLLRLNPTALGTYTCLVDSVATPRKWGIFRESSTALYIQHSGASTSVTCTPALVVNSWQTLVVTYDAAAKRTTAYLEGIQVGTNTHAQAIVAYVATPIRLGTNPSGGGLHYNGKYALFALWDRPLTAAEAFAVGTEPYILFRNPTVLTLDPDGAVTGRTGALGLIEGVSARTAAILGRTGTRALQAGITARVADIVGRAGVRGLTASVRTTIATVTGATGAQGLSATAKAGLAALTGRAGTKAVNAATKETTATVTGRAGVQGTLAVATRTSSGTLVGRGAAQALAVALTSRAAATIGSVAARALSTIVKATVATESGRAGPRALAVAAKAVAVAVTGRAGSRGTVTTAKGAIGAAVGRAGVQAQTTAVAFTFPHTVVGTTAARAQCVGLRSVSATVQGSTSARVTAIGVMARVDSVVGRAGCTALTPGIGNRIAGILGRAGAVSQTVRQSIPIRNLTFSTGIPVGKWSTRVANTRWSVGGPRQ